MGFISDGYRTASKVLSCGLCGGKIKKGDEYRLAFYYDDGGIFSLCEHTACFATVSELNDDCSIEPGDCTQEDFDEPFAVPRGKMQCTKCHR